MRAQISQIEKYNAAVNTFRGKYGYLPGDIKDPDASNFGFQVRGQYAGEGDGNGLIDGNYFNTSGGNSSYGASNGETMVLWADLSMAGLIEGSFTSASDTSVVGNLTGAATLQSYLPPAKIGLNNYVYPFNFQGANYWNILAINVAGNGLNSSPSMTVAQAQAIDKKMDDGLPQSGNVLALYVTGGTSLYWAGAPGNSWPPYTVTVPGNSASCFDNGGVNGTAQSYSVEIGNGAGVNCALSFRFQ